MNNYLLAYSNNGYRHSGRVSDEMSLVGAIAGDIIGSVHELKGTRIKTTNFELFPNGATFTDDTVMTIAVTKWLNSLPSIPRNSSGLIEIMRQIGNKYKSVGYGNNFKQWLTSERPEPYYSYGNGSAMRVASAGLFGQSLKECQQIARITAGVTHNHPEGLKGAEVVASAIRLAKCHKTKECIKLYIEKKYGYNLTRRLDDIRESYEFDPTCQGSVPEAIICFLESSDLVTAIRLAVSLGGDADTQACIAGSIAGAYYGEAPIILSDKLKIILPSEFIDIITSFVINNNLVEKTICEDINIDKEDIISALS